MNSTTEWVTIEGQGWEITYNGLTPAKIDVLTAIHEAKMNARTGLGYEATVTFHTYANGSESVQVITASALHNLNNQITKQERNQQ